MVNYKKNEDGYAMVLVLLLIVFITIISAAFMRTSISNAKQERKVDENNLSFVMAEMGVEFYSTFYINVYDIVKADLLAGFVKEFSLEKNRIIGDKKIIDKEAAIASEHKRLQSLTTAKLEEALNDSKLPKNKNENYSIIGQGEEFDITSTETVTHINGYVKGEYKDGKDAKLHMDLTFKTPYLLGINADNDNSSDDSELVNWDWHQSILIPTISKPTNICTNNLAGKVCLADQNTSFKNIDKTTLYFEDEYDFKNNTLENAKNSTFYFEDDVEMKNMNNVNNAIIIAKDSLKAKNINFTKSELYVEDELEADQLTLNDSLVYVADQLELESHFNSNNSKTFVEGEMEVKHFIVENNSQIYIKDQLDVNGKMEISKSFLKVVGDVELEKKATFTNSIIFFNKDFETDDKIDILNESKVCIGGEADFKSNKLRIDDSSWLFILESNKNLEKNPRVKKVGTIQELNEACMFTGNINGTINTGWDPPKIDVTYSKS